MKTQIDINKAVAVCIKNGVLVYPIPSGSRFKIQVKSPNELITYDKEIDGKFVANAQSKTYKYHALKILDNANKTSK